MTLYTFDRDAAGSGKSVCNGPCATLWPPLMAADTDKASGDYAVIVRDDGKKQWAYKGKPLYYFARDTKAGERTGDGFNQVWKTARPELWRVAGAQAAGPGHLPVRGPVAAGRAPGTPGHR